MNIHGAAAGSWCRSGFMVQQYDLVCMGSCGGSFILFFSSFGLPFYNKLQRACSWGAMEFTDSFRAV